MKSRRNRAWMIVVACLALFAITGCGDDDPNCPKAKEVIPDPCVVVMDDAWADLGQGTDPTGFYTTYGLTFDNTAGYGLIGGDGNGDPGNWDIEGTVGSAAWGLWSGDHSIDLPASSFVSMDFLRGHNDGTFSITASFEGSEVSTVTITLTGPYDIETVSFLGPVDRIAWNNACCFGLDNIRYTEVGLDCPPTWSPPAKSRFDGLEDTGSIYSR